MAGGLSASEIRRLCQEWNRAATGGGGIAIGGATEQFRLHRNEVRFHELSFEALRAAIVGLTEILLLPGMNTVVDLDHALLWSWLAELLIGGDGPLSPMANREISELAATAARAALANVRAPTREAFEEARQVSERLDGNAREFLTHAHTALPYLAFPLLEAVARRACAAFVDLRGVVLQPFARRAGRAYLADGKARCSNVGDLLALLVGTVASADLSADLVELLDHVASHATAQGGSDGYAVLFDWRNSSLHGETMLSTIGGTVLSLAWLVAVHGIADDFSSRQEAAVARARREVEMAELTGRWRPSPWSYYPPFL